jgi:Flp pilus assembly protein TadD
MRHPIFVSLCLGGIVALSACDKKMSDAQVERALKDVNVIDESNLNDIMLTVADPNEAVAYFAKTLKQNPDRIDLKRGLAASLIRAKRPAEAAAAWEAVIADPQSGMEDRVEYADALIRTSNWDKAETVLNGIPPTHETFKRYRLEAMIADTKKIWDKADAFYEIAVGLTTTPATTYNNWGFSKLSRGDPKGAEQMFTQALTYDRNLFTAKNNLVLARASQRNYELPVIAMTQIERSELLYTMALAAFKQGDVTIGKGLLHEAIDTHPQHFEAAVRSLKALEANVSNG